MITNIKQEVRSTSLNSKTLKDVLVGRENYFDLIRLIAAVLVIYSHAYPLSGSGSEDPLYRLSNGQVTLGNLSVFVFFIISGFLITQSYLYSNNIISFMKSRLLRIFPGLLGVLIFSTFLLGPIVTTLPFKEYIVNRETFHYIKAVLLYPMQWNLPGVFENNVYKDVVNGSLWTIPFEFLCYIIVGVLGFTGFLKHKYWMLLFTIITYYCYIFGEKMSPSGEGHIFGLEVKTIIELLTFFLIGSLACLFKDKIFLKKEIAMVSIVILYISIYYGGFKPLFAVFGTYIILYLAFLPKSFLSGVTKKGDFSYGIYLYAFPIQQTVTFYSGGKSNVFSNFLISLPLTLLFAIGSWYIIERNFLKLKKVKLVNFYVLKVPKPIEKLRLCSEGIFNRIFKINWGLFAIYFGLFIVLFINYNSKPSIIEFPYHNSERIFSGGWLPQNNGENYRWIAKKASVELSLPSQSTLLINGFVPESFKEVEKVNIYLNGNKIKESDVKPGEGFSLDLPVHSEYKNNIISIEFNAVHTPLPGDADQREMSGLISKIQIKKSQ